MNTEINNKGNLVVKGDYRCTIMIERDGKTLQLHRGVTTMRWTFVVDGNGKLIYRDNEVSAASDP